jgi:flagella basal body P-ring formation protein FlgA
MLLRTLALIMLAAPAWSLNGVTEEDIHRTVRDFVHAELEGRLEPQQRIGVNVRWQGDILLDTAGKVKMQVRRHSDRPFRGPTIVRLEILVGGVTQRELVLTVDTRYFEPVLVSGRGIRRHEAFDEASIAREERDITQVKDGYFTDIAQLDRLQARRPIGAGDMITQRQVQKIPVVHRGDAVDLTLVSSFMEITTPGTVLQDGGIGDKVRVRNMDSGKVVQGKVLDDKTVQVR